MSDYIEVNLTDGVAIFDTPKFMKVQTEIYKKYEVDGISYINNINNYFLHVMEEVWEAKEVMENRDEEFLGELVDVLMYLGSTVNCFDNEDDKTMYLIKREKLIFSPKLMDIDEFECVPDVLIEIRREYPERKWHKKYYKEDIDHVDRSNKTTIGIQNAMTYVLRSMLSTFSLDQINKAIESKQEYILSLK